MTVGGIPELSVAVGGIQVTGADVVPRATFSVTVPGHPLITGGNVSTAVTESEKPGASLLHWKK